MDGPHFPNYFAKGQRLDVDLANILLKGLKRHLNGQTAMLAVYCEDVDIGTIGNILTSAPNPLFVHIPSYCGFFDQNEDTRRGDYFNVSTIPFVVDKSCSLIYVFSSSWQSFLIYTCQGLFHVVVGCNFPPLGADDKKNGKPNPLFFYNFLGHCGTIKAQHIRPYKSGVSKADGLGKGEVIMPKEAVDVLLERFLQHPLRSSKLLYADTIIHNFFGNQSIKYINDMKFKWSANI
jgi:hypothetical protein